MPVVRTKRDTEHNHNDHLKPKFVSNHTHFSSTDKDAQVNVKPEKPRQMNYSMQTSVDMDSHIAISNPMWKRILQIAEIVSA